MASRSTGDRISAVILWCLPLIAAAPWVQLRIASGGPVTPLMSAQWAAALAGCVYLGFSAASDASWQALKIQAAVFLTASSVFLATFAQIYWVLSSSDSAAFNHVLDRVDAAYFAVTTFSTTGFGDFHAKSTAAEVAVTLQMVLGVVLVVVFGGIAVSRLAARVRR